MVVTLGGRSTDLVPRLKTDTRWPAVTASATQDSEMFPVPPMKRTFRDMSFCLLSTHDGLGVPDTGSQMIVLARAGAKVAPSIKGKRGLFV